MLIYARPPAKLTRDIIDTLIDFHKVGMIDTHTVVIIKNHLNEHFEVSRIRPEVYLVVAHKEGAPLPVPISKQWRL